MRSWFVWDNHRSYDEWNFLAKECLEAYGKPANSDASLELFKEGMEPVQGAIEIARSNGWHACRKRMEADAEYKVEGKND
jgi:hypothetical protein